MPSRSSAAGAAKRSRTPTSAAPAKVARTAEPKKRADRTVRDVVKTTPAGVAVKMVKSWQKLSQRHDLNSIERQVTGTFEVGPRAYVVQVLLRYGNFEGDEMVKAEFGKSSPLLGCFWTDDDAAYSAREPTLKEFMTAAGLPLDMTSPKCTSNDEGVQLKWVCAEIVDTMVAHFVDKYGAEKNDMGLGPTDDDVFYWLGAKTAPGRAPRSSDDFMDKHKTYFHWPSDPITMWVPMA